MAHVSVAVPHGRSPVATLAPGLALAGLVAAAAYGVRLAPGLGSFSPMILALGLGVVVRAALGPLPDLRPGVVFAMRRVLRFAIVLLGLQLTVGQVAEVGAGGVAIIAASLGATFLATIALGRMLGVDARLTQLIAAGTSICGASAILAANTAVRGRDEDVAYAVACVTVFGSIAMFAYPHLASPLGLDAHAYGLWSGTSIHEIAQVVAAAFQQGSEAGEFGVVAKLARVMMLAPVVAALGVYMARSGDPGARAPFPWFVLGFVALVALNSLVALPAVPKTFAIEATPALLAVALAAMGLETDLVKLREQGLRPLLLGLASFLFIASFSLALVKLTT
ncbi:YeiH family protein [Methylopila sp. Yamaguchi]|uniref:YeiH family protein n=1 Tax=Methylopila sp. Yamaguchi TaxID=1437817 RepID=UPI000CCC4A1E|nr:YeiH family protein [Methylopila sp. Yamaguchi]